MIHGTLGKHKIAFERTRGEVVQAAEAGRSAEVSRRDRARLFAYVGAGTLVAAGATAGGGLGSPGSALVVGVVAILAFHRYRMLAPRAPLPRDAAEQMVGPGLPCLSCREALMPRTTICPACGRVLRPAVVVLALTVLSGAALAAFSWLQ